MTTTDPRQDELQEGPPPYRRRPPRVPVQEAIRRHWVLALVPALLFVLAAIAIAFFRTPTYTAEARLNVGDISVPNTSVGQAVLGNQTLAATYSRLIGAQQVAAAVSQEIGIPAEQVPGLLGASPIPESTIIRVEATGTTAADAVQLANVGGDALIAHIAAINADQTKSQELLADFENAVKAESDAKTLRDDRQVTFSNDPSTRNEQELRDADAKYQAAQLERSAKEDAYRASLEGTTGNRDVQVVTPATSAASDRSSVLQRLAFIGLIGGLAAGIALATVRSNSGRRVLPR